MSSTSSNIDLEQQSGSPSGNERTLASSISLIIGVLCYAYGLFPITFHRHRHGAGLEGPIDVETGVEAARGALELQADAAPAASAAEPSRAFVFPPSNLVNGRSTPVAVTQAESERGQTSSVPEENGQPVVGIWIVPTVIGVLSCLIQVVEGSQKANSDQKLLLYLCSSMSLGTASLGIMVFIMQWINSPRRHFIIRLMSAVALGFSLVDICLLIIFLLLLSNQRPTSNNL